MSNIKVGLLGTCGYNNFKSLTGGKVITDVPSALRKDILIFTGGEDVSPSLYNEPNRLCMESNFKRDQFEKNVLIRALAFGIKVLGICRGHQLINAVLGGKLYQDIYYDTGVRHNAMVKDGFGNLKNVHNFSPEEESFWAYESLAYIFPNVNSLHHQAVSIPGKGLDIILRARDGIIESTMSKDRNIVTFQFHPEWMGRLGENYFERVMDTGQLVW